MPPLVGHMSNCFCVAVLPAEPNVLFGLAKLLHSRIAPEKRAGCEGPAGLKRAVSLAAVFLFKIWLPLFLLAAYHTRRIFSNQATTQSSSQSYKFITSTVVVFSCKRSQHRLWEPSVLWGQRRSRRSICETHALVQRHACCLLHNIALQWHLQRGYRSFRPMSSVLQILSRLCKGLILPCLYGEHG